MADYCAHSSKLFKLRIQLKNLEQEKITVLNWQRGERIECCHDTITP